MIVEIQKYWGDREIYNSAELCSKIIHSMQTDGEVTLMTKEGRSAKANGGYALLDELCNYWKWDKSKITLVTPNHYESHPEYNIVRSFFSHSAQYANINFPRVPWTKEKLYGMFIGRANAPRIRAIHNHAKFKFKHLGLTSFHDDLFEYMDKTELVDYFMASGQTYKEMISITPYSDIDEVRRPPLEPKINNAIDWASVYSKIGIEIICETSTAPGCFTKTEKLDRCLIYGRPFLTIAPAGFNEHLKRQRLERGAGDLSIRTFEDKLNSYYDDLEGIARVDAVFKILENLIETGKIYSVLEDCKEDIEHNYETVRKAHALFSNQTLKTDKDAVLWEYWGRYKGKPDE